MIRRYNEGERRYMKSQICKHPNWPAYMAANGMNSGSISSSRQINEICEEIGLDVEVTMAHFDNGTYPANDASSIAATGAIAFGDKAKPEPAPQRVAPQAQASAPVDALSQALSQVLASACNEDRVKAIVDEALESFKPATPTRTIVLEPVTQNSVDVGITHKQFKALLKLCSIEGGNTLLHGGAGGGKTSATKQVAKAMGREFTHIGYVDMDYRLVGYVSQVNGEYHESAFVKALRVPSVILLDDLDRWEQAPLTSLFSVLANGYITLPNGEVVERHSDCVIVGACNSISGANATYATANRFDGALSDRFVKLEWLYDRELMKAMSAYPEWAERVLKAMDNAAMYGVKTLISPRAIEQGSALLDAGFSMEEAASMTYLAGLTSEQCSEVEEEI